MVSFILSLMIDDQEIIMYSLLVLVKCSKTSQQPTLFLMCGKFTHYWVQKMSQTANFCSNICGKFRKVQSLLVFSFIPHPNLQIVVLNNKYLPPISIPSPSTTHLEEWQLTCSRIIHNGLGLYCTKIIPINASILKKMKNMGGRKIWPWICWFVLKKLLVSSFLHTEMALVVLIPWSWDKMAAILQTTFADAFSWMKIGISLKLTIFQHWFR